MPNFFGTSGNKSCSQLISIPFLYFTANNAKTDIRGGSVFATMIEFFLLCETRQQLHLYRRSRSQSYEV